MWERPKTQYDYARFFNEWYRKDIASFVRRDRNHPCILFWRMLMNNVPRLAILQQAGALNLRKPVSLQRDCGFSMGQYLWTGFDYIGEPTPYHTRNSYFGQIDTAGFPKDSYYIYQAEWTDYKVCPMIHVFPYWDFNPDQQIGCR